MNVSFKAACLYKLALIAGLLVVAFTLWSCSPSSKHLQDVSKKGTVLLLTDSDGRKYTAKHLDSDIWELQEVQ